MTNFKVGDLLIRIESDWGDHKVGQSYEVESISTPVEIQGRQISTVRFKGCKGGYDLTKYELDPICRSPLYEALK